MTHVKLCNVPRHDSYMHVVPFSSKVVTSWCKHHIIVNDYNQWLYGYKYPVNGYMDVNIRHDIWWMNIWLNQPCICSQQVSSYNQRLYIYIYIDTHKHAFFTNHIKINMYEFTTNNQRLACSLININIVSMLIINQHFRGKSTFKKFNTPNINSPSFHFTPVI